MDAKKSELALKIAEKCCAEEGVQFTSKRKSLLEVMLKAEKALSAYEVVGRLKEAMGIIAPAMTVYRILDFLEQRQFVHKIVSINKYVACMHMHCQHGHDMPRFAVCMECFKVEELLSRSSIKQELEQGLENIDFRLESQQLELSGLCSICSKL